MTYTEVTKQMEHGAPRQLTRISVAAFKQQLKG